MAKRINRAIELLEADQAIYYDGPHTGHVLTYEQGRQDAKTWADYINVGMEHGAFDMTALAEYMRGLVDGGPTNSGHRTPAIIVEAPVNGIDGPNVAFNAWQFRQILAPRRARHPALPGRVGRRREGVRARLPLPASQGRRRQDRPSAPAAAARSRRPRRSGALISRSILPAASRGRSIRRASFCSV